MPKAKSKSKSQPVHIKSWYDTIYGVEHRFMQCPREDAESYFRDTFGAEHDIPPGCVARATSVSCPGKTFIMVYWFKPDISLKTPDGQMRIAHEALHGVEFVMAARNTPLCDETSEPRAYYLEAVFGAINEMVDLKDKPTIKPRRKK